LTPWIASHFVPAIPEGAVQRHIGFDVARNDKKRAEKTVGLQHLGESRRTPRAQIRVVHRMLGGLAVNRPVNVENFAAHGIIPGIGSEKYVNAK
jgi:hypothetical protein